MGLPSQLVMDNHDLLLSSVIWHVDCREKQLTLQNMNITGNDDICAVASRIKHPVEFSVVDG